MAATTIYATSNGDTVAKVNTADKKVLALHPSNSASLTFFDQNPFI
jgi:hypothetical protein